jgi:hypothetical protein
MGLDIFRSRWSLPDRHGVSKRMRETLSWLMIFVLLKLVKRMRFATRPVRPKHHSKGNAGHGLQDLSFSLPSGVSLILFAVRLSISQSTRIMAQESEYAASASAQCAPEIGRSLLFEKGAEQKMGDWSPSGHVARKGDLERLTCSLIHLCHQCIWWPFLCP